MNLQTWPLFNALEDKTRILLAGAGGGFDIYSGIPLYFALRQAGKEVELANLSFTTLPADEEHWLTTSCMAVTTRLADEFSYFPELTLAQWFELELGELATIYTFPLTGVAPLRESYEYLCAKLELDAIILVDGGTDSLMRGDEMELGTPAEDMASLAAATTCGLENVYLASIGFGIDTFHGVCHAHFLEAVSDLTKAGAFLGVSTVLPQFEEARRFQSLVAFANERTPSRPSIVANSIASAIAGEFGDHHVTARTQGSELWINALMPIYWALTLLRWRNGISTFHSLRRVRRFGTLMSALPVSEVASRIASGRISLRRHNPLHAGAKYFCLALQKCHVHPM